MLFIIWALENVSRINLSKANEIREVRIFQEFADKIVPMVREKRGIVNDFFYQITKVSHPLFQLIEW